MTAKILTFFNQKGGVGKTNLTMQVGGALALRGYNVQIFDLDEQGTAMNWSTNAEAGGAEFPARVASLAPLKAKFAGEVQKHASFCDFILLDCPPSLENLAPHVALTLCDLVIVPVIPSPGEMHSTAATKRLILEARTRNPSLVSRAVINRAPRTSLARVHAEVLRADPELLVFQDEISDLAAYADSQFRGICVTQLGRPDKAARQLQSLVDQILGEFGIGVTGTEGTTGFTRETTATAIGDGPQSTAAALGRVAAA